MPNSLFSRCRSTSRWSSPIPDSNNWPLSSSFFISIDGSSCISAPKTFSSFASSDWFSVSTLTVNTGDWMCIGSNRKGKAFFGVINVSPVCNELMPWMATICPSRDSFSVSVWSADICRILCVKPESILPKNFLRLHCACIQKHWLWTQSTAVNSCKSNHPLCSIVQFENIEKSRWVLQIRCEWRRDRRVSFVAGKIGKRNQLMVKLEEEIRQSDLFRRGEIRDHCVQ